MMVRSLAGDAGNDTLRGNDGNDILYGDGRIGMDFYGPAGSDPMRVWTDVGQIDPGFAGGDDTLLGGRGNDTLYGGRGNDLMTGNQGVDRFVIEAGSGTDRVTDFAVDIDKIVFSGIAGIDDFGDLTIVRSGSDTLVHWGTGDSLRLVGVRPSQLDAGDFEFAATSPAASFGSPDIVASGDYPFA